ncbi:DUF2612 domain-containing protein [Neisseria sp. Marseille-Q1983]|uniref:DUF2612 domain-containing protein n=1 Tax=Neisseria sp. Marseille-Q1983 TaxID=2830768 RepID=UPI001BA82E30|nr:DUF2612 domain-containing protein [Neisseria sp. Marseille-Q1983]
MIDVKETVISQYANSSVICRLIRRFDECIDPRADRRRFYDTVWNVSTAQGFGLDIWGAIVGIGREVMIAAQDEYIGFTQGFTPFGNGVWSSGEGLERQYRLDDDAYRRVIMLKAMSNIIYATAPHINRLLHEMFGTRGRAYFVKNGTMAARYVFEFYLLPVERAIIRQSDLLPRPSGVLLDFYEPEEDKTFGYIEANLAPFGEGAFFMGV